MLEPGIQAPGFGLLDQNGDKRFLSEFLGKPLVLILFDDFLSWQVQYWLDDIYWNLEEFKRSDAAIVAICGNFENEVMLWDHPLRKHMPLLSDPIGRILTVYKALPTDLRRGDRGMATNTAFLIDPGGVIREAWYFVRVVQHTRKALAALESFTLSQVLEK